MKKKVIGFALDGVIRDLIGKITELYLKEVGTTDEFIIDEYKLAKYFQFEGGEEEFDHFLYQEFPLEIFGHAKETIKHAMYSFNQFMDMLNKLDQNKYETIIISCENGRSLPATLFFLSKTLCHARKVVFTTTEAEKWDYVNVLVDSNPYTLAEKPAGKVSVKVKQSYNKDVAADVTIENVKEILEDGFLKKIGFKSKRKSTTLK